eukprot:TRINITY_DN53775_c0_g1_i1.p1 TRINITY_DN53775_c0_g1~~TRINITY_DN53775_c0_g1_i1.p1  ORF type:complete len:235 (-),score=49.38 TRINITY_DN53775_c0_g1_i1:51-674(-)
MVDCSEVLPRLIVADEEGREEIMWKEKEAWAPSQLFDVKIVREEGRYIGVRLTAAGQVCMVESILKGSCIDEWNEAHPSERVQQYDWLWALNGLVTVRGKDMVLLLKRSKDDELVFTFARHNLNQVVFQGRGKELGLVLKEGVDFLLVGDVDEGIVEDYNSTVAVEKRLTASSRILSVDGVKGTARDLMDRISNGSQEVTIEYVSWS